MKTQNFTMTKKKQNNFQNLVWKLRATDAETYIIFKKHFYL